MEGIPVGCSIHGVRNGHVIGRDRLGNSAGCCPHAEKPPGHLLTSANFSKGAIPQRIQVDFQCLCHISKGSQSCLYRITSNGVCILMQAAAVNKQARKWWRARLVAKLLIGKPYKPISGTRRQVGRNCKGSGLVLAPGSCVKHILSWYGNYQAPRKDICCCSDIWDSAGRTFSAVL